MLIYTATPPFHLQSCFVFIQEKLIKLHISYNLFQINIFIMSSWNYGDFSSSKSIEDQPVIPDIIDKFISYDNFEDIPYDHEIVPISAIQI